MIPLILTLIVLMIGSSWIAIDMQSKYNAKESLSDNIDYMLAFSFAVFMMILLTILLINALKLI